MKQELSHFIFIVGFSSKEQAHIYQHIYKWLLRVVHMKLAMTEFDIAKLVIAEDDQVDVCIKIAISRSSYLKYFGSTMNEADMNYELVSTIQEIKLRCARALQTLHERIGKRVKPPDKDDIRILVSWLV
jgi:hypothetical protein